MAVELVGVVILEHAGDLVERRHELCDGFVAEVVGQHDGEGVFVVHGVPRGDREGRSGSGACAALARSLLGVEDLEEELFIEGGELVSGAVGEELCGHVGEHAVVAHGVVGERVGKFRGEQARVARGAGEVLEAGEELVARGVLEGEACADARAAAGHRGEGAR